VAPKNILDGDRLLGYSHKLSFLRKRGDGVRHTGWVINEFHLHKHDEDGPGRKIEGRVLCKMYQSNRTKNYGARVARPRSTVTTTTTAAARPSGPSWRTTSHRRGGRGRVGALPPARAQKRVAAAAAYDDTPASWLQHCP